MKKLTAVLLALLLTVLFPIYSFTLAFAAQADEEPEILLYTPDDADVAVLPDGSTYLNNCISVYFKDDAILSQIQKILRTLGGDVVGILSPINAYQLKIKKMSYRQITALCEQLMQFDAVELAMPSYVEQCEPDLIPDDPWDGYNYELAWTSQPRSSHANWWVKAIDANKAWDYNAYFHPIKVGIVDTGVQVNHEDLEGKISFPNKFFEESNIPDDHGTHVTGIVGAIANNGKGITGLTWNSELICVDWQPDKDAGQKWTTTERIVSGFIFSVLSGAKVVNFSLGTSGHLQSKTTDEHHTIKDAYALADSLVITKLLRRGYDFIAVQSAGNGTELPDGSSYAVDSTNNGYLCAMTPENVVCFDSAISKQELLDHIIVVGAAKCNNDGTYGMSYFSNGGKYVSVYAPGSSIYSTYYRDWEPETTNACKTMSGTSMAAPIVTGVASMVWSVNPDFSAGEVKDMVCKEANTPIIVEDNTSSDHLPTGDGRMVNAGCAVADAVSRMANYGTVSGKVDWQKLGSGDLPYTIENTETHTAYRGRMANGAYEKQLPAGSYKLSLNANGKTYSIAFAVAAGETTAAPQLTLQSQSGSLIARLTSFFSENLGFLVKVIRLALKYIK